MISNALKAKIHIAIDELGIDDDLYRDILSQQFKVGSCVDLSPRQADALLKHFRSLGWRPRIKRRKRGNEPLELPTPQQLALLKHLYLAIGWLDSKRHMGFNKKLCGKPWPQTRAEANRIIEGLKSMKARGYSERKVHGEV